MKRDFREWKEVKAFMVDIREHFKSRSNSINLELMSCASVTTRKESSVEVRSKRLKEFPSRQ